MALRNISNLASPLSLRRTRGKKPIGRKQPSVVDAEDTLDDLTKSREFVLIAAIKNLRKKSKNNVTNAEIFRNISYSGSLETPLDETDTPSSTCRGSRPLQRKVAEITLNSVLHEDSLNMLDDSFDTSTSSFVVPQKPFRKKAKNKKNNQITLRDISCSESPTVHEAPLNESDSPSSTHHGSRPLQRKGAAMTEEMLNSVQYEDSVNIVDDLLDTSTSSFIMPKKPFGKKAKDNKTNLDFKDISYSESLNESGTSFSTRHSRRVLKRKIVATTERSLISNEDVKNILGESLDSTSSFTVPQKPFGKKPKNSESNQDSFREISYLESLEATLTESSTPSSTRCGSRPLQRKVAAKTEETLSFASYEESDEEYKNPSEEPDGADTGSARSSISSYPRQQKPLGRKPRNQNTSAESLKSVSYSASPTLLRASFNRSSTPSSTRRGSKPLQRKVAATEKTLPCVAYEESVENFENHTEQPDGADTGSARSSISSDPKQQKPLGRKSRNQNTSPESLRSVSYSASPSLLKESLNRSNTPSSSRQGSKPLQRKVAATEETLPCVAYEESQEEPDGAVTLSDTSRSSIFSCTGGQKPLGRKSKNQKTSLESSMNASYSASPTPQNALLNRSDASLSAVRGSKPLQRKVTAATERTMPLVDYEDSTEVVENTSEEPIGLDSLNRSERSASSGSKAQTSAESLRGLSYSESPTLVNRSGALPSVVHGRKLFQRQTGATDETLPSIDYEESTEDLQNTQEKTDSSNSSVENHSSLSSSSSEESPEKVCSDDSALRCNSVSSPFALTLDGADSSIRMMTVIEPPTSTVSPMDWASLEERIALKIKNSIARGLERAKAKSDARNPELRKSPKPPPKPARVVNANQPLKPRVARIKRYKPAPWANARLYNYLIGKIRKNFELERVLKAEELVRVMWTTVRAVERSKHYPQSAVRRLKIKLAALGIVVTTYDFYSFLRSYLPQYIHVKMIPSLQPFTNMIWPPNVDNKDPSEPILD